MNHKHHEIGLLSWAEIAAEAVVQAWGREEPKRGGIGITGCGKSERNAKTPGQRRGLVGPGADPNNPCEKSLELRGYGRLESKTALRPTGSVNYVYFIRQLYYEIILQS
jgi:hypothetical protein